MSGTLVLLDGDAAVGGREGLGVERGGREQGGAGDEGVGAQWESPSVLGGDTCDGGLWFRKTLCSNKVPLPHPSAKYCVWMGHA